MIYWQSTTDDLTWPHMTFPGVPVNKWHLDHHRLDNPSWSWKNWVFLTHLLEVGRISIFSRYVCNVKFMNLTWPQVTDIQILRYTACAWWYPYENLKRRNWSVKNSSSGVIANFFWGGVNKPPLVTWTDLTWPGIFLSKCAQWMFIKRHQVWAFYLAAFVNGTRKTWGGA